MFLRIRETNKNIDIKLLNVCFGFYGFVYFYDIMENQAKRLNVSRIR